MRRLMGLATVAIAVLAVTGCASTMNVSSHVERGLDFAQYRTYDWGPADALPTGDARLDNDPFFHDHVQGEVERQLAFKGFARSVSESPDLLLHYHANINRRIDVDRLDRERGYCSGDECGPGVIEYEAGTLVLDIVDVRTNRVVWRGWAQESVENSLNDRDRMARQINEAVTRMLKRLPAGR